MKLQNWALAYTLVMFFMLFFMLHILEESRFQSRDMIFYNKQQKEIEGLLESREDRAETEDRFQCSLLFFDDEDYQQRLYEL